MKVELIALMLLFHVVYCEWLMVPKEINYIYKRTECKRFNSKYGYKVLCPYRFFNRSMQQNSIEIYIHPGMKIDKVFVELTTHKKFGTEYRPTLINLKENFCDVVSNKSDSFFAQQLRILLKNGETNFNEPCPLMGKKYRFPPLIPIGDWKVVTELVTYMNGTKEFLVELADFWEF